MACALLGRVLKMGSSHQSVFSLALGDGASRLAVWVEDPVHAPERIAIGSHVKCEDFVEVALEDV
jgi:hypothetical protein